MEITRRNSSVPAWQYDMEPPRDGYASRRMSAPPVCATTPNFSTGAFGATVESLATDTVLAAPVIVRTVRLPIDFAVTFSPEGRCAKALTAKSTAKLIEYAVHITNAVSQQTAPGRHPRSSSSPSIARMWERDWLIARFRSHYQSFFSVRPGK